MKRLETIYHTDNATDEELVRHFTIRKQELEQIMNVIKEEGKKSFQNILIVGKRGMGKSTLLRRLDIETRQKLQEKAIAVRLRTEGYRTSKLFKMWEQVIENLSISFPNLKEEKEKLSVTKNYEDDLFLLIQDILEKENKKLVLFIDNFDVIIQNFTNKEQHQLREILIQYPVQIIANTLFYLEAFFDYGKPFYDFFKIIKLKNLTQKESLKFIDEILEEEERLGNPISSHKSLNTVNTLCLLAGGVPRTIILLTSVLFDDNLETTMEHLKKMVELTTPLYQDRMRHLSPQQQEIMHTLAMIWDKTGTNEIAKRMRTESKTVSAQLKVLEQNGYIVKENTKNKNHLYYIDERFFNIWFLMSEGTPYDGSRVRWLTKTLDVLLDEETITQYAKSCLAKLKTTENKYFFVQALSQSEKLPDAYKLDLINIIQQEDKECKHPESGFIALKKDEILKLETEDSIYFKEAVKKYNTDNYKEALQLFQKIKNKNGTTYWIIGLLCEHLEDNLEAEKYYLCAIEYNEDAVFIYTLANLYMRKFKDYLKAEKYYLKAIEYNETKSMNNLAVLYEKEFKDYSKAKKYYLKAIEYNEVKAMNNLANLYIKEFKNYSEAEKYYLKAIENNDTDCVYNLAVLYEREFKDYLKAEKYYLKAIENNDVDAMYNLALLYQTNFKDYSKAEKYYLKAIENNDIKAMYNLAILYEENFKDYSKAEKYYLKAIENNNTDGVYNLVALYLYNNENKKEAMKLINSLSTRYIQSVLYLWNEQVQEGIDTLTLEIVNNEEKLHIHNEELETTLNYFLLFLQKNTLYTLFNEYPILKDVYKVIYYALLQEIQDTNEKEFATMPPELEEPVKLLLEQLKNARVKYGV
ncbi:MAG: tetratricopeptide repeat protein [Raineya sp.]|jgi:TPR repeat protein|nr:tetratricopeptide repeat protein [Raineya sp.]